MAESAVARRTADRTATAGAERTARGIPGKRLLGYALLILLSILYLAPLVWMISTSFKTQTGATSWPLQWIPDEISTHGYDTIFNSGAERLTGWNRTIWSRNPASGHRHIGLRCAAEE